MRRSLSLRPQADCSGRCHFCPNHYGFHSDKVRSDIVALCSLALLLVTNVLTPGEALAGFSNSAVVMMIGLFIVGGAVFQTGLPKSFRDVC